MKKLCISISVLLVLIIAQTHQVSAQVTGWINTEQGMGGSICTDQFDNSYSCGQFVGSTTIGSTTYTSLGAQDVIIEKHDPSGNLIWATPFGGTQGDFSSKIIFDGFSNVWVTGTFRGSMTAGNFTLVAAGGSDAFLVKLDASTGTILYAEHAGGTGDDAGMSVKEDNLGDIILAGSFTGNFSMGGVPLTGQGIDVFFVKLDNSGTPLWGKKISGTGIETMWSMTTDLSGNIYIAGFTSSASASFAGTPVNFTASSVFAAKFDDAGNYVWSAPAQFNGELYGISVDAAGSVYFTGNFDTQATIGPFPLTGAGNDDILIVKVNSSGSFAWAHSYGGTGIDEGYDLQCDAQGNLFVTGSFQGSFTFGSTIISAGSFNKSYTAKLDSSGSVEWVIQSGGAASSHINSGISMNGIGDIYVTGNGSGVFNMGSCSDSVAGSYLVKISDNANIIKGNVFTDMDSDGILDPGETGLPNVILELDNSPYVCASNNSGIYQMYTSSGTHTVTIPNLPLYHTLTTPAVLTSVFTGMGAMDTAKNFGLYPIPNVNDLSIDITPVSNPKAGHVLTYLITYKNVGTTSQNTVISLQFDQAISYLSAAPAPANQLGQTLTWNAGILMPMASGTIHAQFNIPAGMAIGSPITATAGITPLAADSTPANNSQTIVSLVTAPYDPNYKEVNIDTLYSVSTPGWLEYTIHFQNIGNDTAINVIIADTLSTHLDLSTFEMISSSHALPAFSIKGGNIAEFRFSNIMLPDSSTDPDGSNGFVKYRLKFRSTLAVNNAITNAAAIFFDYNTPIITNTAFTYYIDSTAGVNEVESGRTRLYPNPAADHIVIECQELTENTMIVLYSMQGVKILEQRLTDAYTIITLNDLARGIYVAMISNNKGTVVRKIVKK